jgi:hypothetical protein
MGGSMSPLPAIPVHQSQETAAVLERRLKDAATLEARLGNVLEAVRGRVAFSTSLGLEDQVILHAASQVARGIDIGADLGDDAASERELRRRANEVAILLRGAGVAVEIEEDRWRGVGTDAATVGLGILAALAFGYAAAIVLGIV